MCRWRCERCTFMTRRARFISMSKNSLKRGATGRKQASEAIDSSGVQLTPDVKNLAMRVSLLRYRHGLSNIEIGNQLGVTPSYVSKLNQVAEANGWVQFVFMGPPETELEARIATMTGRKLRYVRVVASPQQESERERLLGAALAERLDSVLTDFDRETTAGPCATVAIGGSQAMYAATQCLLPRARSANVIPTALTQFTGAVPRTNAQLVATLLAGRIGALPSEYARYADQEQSRGRLFLAALGTPPVHLGLSQFAEWIERLDEAFPGMRDIRQAWEQVDVAVVGIAPVDPDNLYPDTKEKLALLGIPPQQLKKRGVVGLLANRFISERGTLVPLSETPQLESYEVVMPTRQLTRITAGGLPQGRTGHSILVCGGPQGTPAASAVAGGMVNSLICDRTGAEKFIEAWKKIDMA